MSRLCWLNDGQWSKIEPLLPRYGGSVSSSLPRNASRLPSGRPDSTSRAVRRSEQCRGTSGSTNGVDRSSLAAGCNSRVEVH